MVLGSHCEQPVKNIIFNNEKKQFNGHDCGVWVLIFAYCYFFQKQISTVKEECVRFFRRAIIVDILNFIENLRVNEMPPFMLRVHKSIKNSTYDNVQFNLPAIENFQIPHSNALHTCNHNNCNTSFINFYNLNKHEKKNHTNCFDNCASCLFWSEHALNLHPKKVTQDYKTAFSSKFSNLQSFSSKQKQIPQKIQSTSPTSKVKSKLFSSYSTGTQKLKLKQQLFSIQNQMKECFSQLLQGKDMDFKERFVQIARKFSIDYSADGIQFRDNSSNKLSKEITIAEIEHEDQIIYSKVSENISKVFQKIPSNSPVRKAFIRTLFNDIPVETTRNLLNISAQSVYSALNNATDLSFYLKELGFKRNKLQEKMPHLLEWFSLNCSTHSGRNQRCYVGDKQTMFYNYFNWCTKEGKHFVSPKIFHKKRKLERIFIQSGDIFSNTIETELGKLKDSIDNNSEDCEDVKSKIMELEQSLSFSKHRKSLLRKEIQDLENDGGKAIFVHDFTGIQTAQSCKFNDYIIVVLSKDPINIPNSLKELAVKQTPPISKNTLHNSEEYQKIEKKKKKKKTAFDFEKSILSHTSSKIIQDKKGKMPNLDPLAMATTSKFKPYSYYFHFIVKTTKEDPVLQTYPYVLWALKLLLVTHNFGKEYTTISNWSDGGPKHFKVYSLHFELSRLCQKISPIQFSWKFLPPRDAHNQCDAAASHIKKTINKLIRDMAIIQSVENIAFGVQFHRLQNILILHVESSSFEPEVQTVTDVAFIRNAFDISYQMPTSTTTFCKHKCADMNSCRHWCCNNPKVRETVSLKCVMRDNTDQTFSIFYDDVERKVDKFELSNIEFWTGDAVWLNHTTPKQPREGRLSKVSGQRKIKMALNTENCIDEDSEDGSDSVSKADDSDSENSKSNEDEDGSSSFSKEVQNSEEHSDSADESKKKNIALDDEDSADSLTSFLKAESSDSTES